MEPEDKTEIRNNLDKNKGSGAGEDWEGIQHKYALDTIPRAGRTEKEEHRVESNVRMQEGIRTHEGVHCTR